MNQIYPLIIIAIIGLFVGSITTYYIVRTSVKDAMKQSEYYLEIIAKSTLKNSKE
ncbi:MAG: hypothetical protein K0R36_599 [Chryseobacterium sp.]|jgi:uncharacterized membrane protein YdjX (TVP38/TMEM64 family)|nr:hypothetical protein [Chryseobacterium sp.]